MADQPTTPAPPAQAPVPPPPAAVASGPEEISANVRTSPALPLGMSGKAGKPFSIDGEGFGDASSDATLEISGRLVPFTRWNDRSIKGELPRDIKPGKFIIRTSSGKVIEGKFNG